MLHGELTYLDGTVLALSMYDLAGSTVIHSTGGWALLAAIINNW